MHRVALAVAPKRASTCDFIFLSFAVQVPDVSSLGGNLAVCTNG